MPLFLQGLVVLLEDEGPRGLEMYSSRVHAQRRQRHLQESKHAVLMEQARQIVLNERDEERLARQASMASRKARTFATLLGQADAWAASHVVTTSEDEDQDDDKDEKKVVVSSDEEEGGEED